MKSKRVLSALFCIYPLMIIGCAPIPHKIATVNPIILHFQCESKNPATILISKRGDDDRCTNAIRKVEINNGETKKIEGLVEISYWMVFVPFDPISGFEVCIKQDGKLYQGMSYTKMGYAKNEVKLECEINKKVTPFENWPVDTTMACKLGNR